MNRLMVGVVSSDSTIVYYSLTEGLVPPESVEDQNAAKLKQRRKLREHNTRTARWHISETTVDYFICEVKYIASFNSDVLTFQLLDYWGSVS